MAAGTVSDMKHPILRLLPILRGFRGWWSERSVRVARMNRDECGAVQQAGQLQVMPSSAATTAADPSLMAATPFSASAALALGGAERRISPSLLRRRG